MSMHKIPLTPSEEEGLRSHGLDIGTPSQLSDAFRQGMAWALSQQEEQPAPAQDGRESVVVVGYAYNMESGAYSQYPGDDWSALMTVAQHERIMSAEQEGYILAQETVVTMPNGKKELGYTLLSGVGIFESRQDVYATISTLSLPLGWVCMTVNQLLPGYMVLDEIDHEQA